MTSSNDGPAVLISNKEVVRSNNTLPFVRSIADSSESLYDEIVLRECSCFIEAANVDFACEGYPERFCAKYLLLNQLHYAIIYGHA